MQRDEIEKRARIAEAFEENPSLSYLALQQRFKTSTRVVTSALRRPSADWRYMVNQQPMTSKNEHEYLGITVRGRVNGGDVDYETQEQGVVGWEKSDAATFADVLAGFGQQGWDVVSVAILQHGSLPFSGTFEVAFKRRI